MKRFAITLVVASAVASLPTTAPLAAEPMSAEGVKKIVEGQVWAEEGLGGLFSETFWTWKADGSLCLRLFEKGGTCDFVGLWDIKGDRVCYSLARGANQAGLRSRCIRIGGPTNGRYNYQALDDNNTTLFKFTALQ